MGKNKWELLINRPRSDACICVCVCVYRYMVYNCVWVYRTHISALFQLCVNIHLNCFGIGYYWLCCFCFACQKLIFIIIDLITWNVLYAYDFHLYRRAQAYAHHLHIFAVFTHFFEGIITGMSVNFDDADKLKKKNNKINNSNWNWSPDLKFGSLSIAWIFAVIQNTRLFEYESSRQYILYMFISSSAIPQNIVLTYDSKTTLMELTATEFSVRS